MGEDVDGCYAHDVLEFVCQEISVFAMGSSRSFGFHDEARLSGRTENILTSTWSAYLSFDHIRLDRG